MAWENPFAWSGDVVDSDYAGEWGPLKGDPNYEDWSSGALDTGAWGPLDYEPGYTGWVEGDSATGAGAGVLDWLKQATGMSGADLAKLGVFGGLKAGQVFGGTGPSNTTTQSYTQPAWYTDAAKATLLKGMQLPEYKSFLTQPGALQRTTDLAPYINPYIKASLDPTIARLEDVSARDINALNARAATTGAFGGSRNILEQNLTKERRDKAIAEATGGAYSEAFKNAQTAFGADRTTSYDDWLNQFKSPYQQAGSMATTLAAVKPEATISRTGTESQGNAWDKLYGLGTQLYGFGENSKAPAKV